MLKPLLLSGWFRVQPFSKYLLVAMLIAPLVAASGHSSAAKQSELAHSSFNSVSTNSDMSSESVEIVNDNDLLQALRASRIDSGLGEIDSAPISIAAVSEPKLIRADAIEPVVQEDYQVTDKTSGNPLATVEVVPPVNAEDSISDQVNLGTSNKRNSQLQLVNKLKAYKLEIARVQPLESVKEKAFRRELTPSDSGITVFEEPTEAEIEAQRKDPLGSPHPIPWEWIMNTHKEISARGSSGVRYYRSSPVNSPDGRYTVYSRLQLEVKPELHNSRVSSVLFIEDHQTKRLKVISSTSANNDVLLKIKSKGGHNDNGSIGVLVPVSWSKQGDRFLARSFESRFQTSDGTDKAVIWNSNQKRVNKVSPTVKKDQHEPISILLGWSESRPGQVLFQSGELGEDDWSLLAVSNNGQTVTANELDKPITYGKEVSNVWKKTQPIYR
ncbi:MAG: hypothetical protein ACFB02_02790 [Mastigocoleus sp.]